MKLYLISQEENTGYDTYSDAVVCAKDEDEAIHIHPSEFVTHYHDGKWYGTYTKGGEYEINNCGWVDFHDIDKVKVEYIGEAKEGMKKGVICASFHAG